MADVRCCGTCQHAEKVQISKSMAKGRDLVKAYIAQYARRCSLDGDLVSEIQYCDKWEARDASGLVG